MYRLKLFICLIVSPLFFFSQQNIKRHTLFFAYAENDDSGFQWPFNSRYTKKDSGCYSYAAMAFSPFVILKNDTESVKINPPPTYFIDTIYVALSHENNSGKNDTIIFKITDLDKNNKPGQNILWSRTIIKNKGLSKNNDWRNQYTHILYEPKLEIKGSKCFALVFEYYGDKSDTCGFRALYKQDTTQIINTINGAIHPALPPFYKKINWLKLPQKNELVSSDQTKYPGKKALSPIQHWDFYVKIRVEK